jgi:CheY-like chemotaxis protein
MPPSPHVLLVDDHDGVRAVLAHLLAQICPTATIAEAAHGAEALSLMAQHNVDLIITDHQMPVMGGLELVHTLRAQGRRMPIVVLSSDSSIAEVILAAGATIFLPKPFPIHDLRAHLRTLLPECADARARSE